MIVRCSLSLLAAVACLAGTAFAEIAAPLSVAERAHVNRDGELAAGGVPFPQGAAKDAAGFCVVNDKGEAVPAQFDVLGRWPADGSIRWMLVQFPVTLKADATASFTLKGGENPKPKDTLKVTDGAETIAVDTGPIDFTVRKKNFALIDGVSRQPKPYVSPMKLGPRLCGDGFVVTTTQPDEAFSMGADADSKVTLEDAGPLRATIRADGRHRSADGKAGLAYRVRITATAGSGRVRVQYTFTHDTGPFDNTPVEVKELAMTLQPRFGGSRRYAFGKAGDGLTTGGGVLGKDAQGCRLAVLDTKSFELKTDTTQTGPVKGARANRLGWFSLVEGGGDSVTAAVRWFWQLNPKALSIAPDGRMKIELVPADAAEPAHIYRGMAKTHDLLLSFMPTPGNEINYSDDERGAVAFQQPLFVKCPPGWYCQDTLSFGRLASGDCKSIRPGFAKFVKAVDDGFDRQIEVIRNERSIVVDPKRGMDSYNMIHFGDGFHHAYGSGHQKVLWDDCYYGYTHLLAMQFARTGRDAILDTLREATMCEGDVCVAWQTLDMAAPRQNPGAYHVGGFGDFDNAPSGTWNFYHPDGLMEAFYLTGDRRYEDAGLANYKWALATDGYDMYNNPRSVGAGLRAMVFGYLATGNKGFLHAGREIARKAERFYRVHGHFAPVSNSVFMCPNALEGLCVFHEFTGEPRLGKVLPEMVAAHFNKFGRNPARLDYAYANLYTARLAGNDELRKQVEAALAGDVKFSVQTGEHHVKDFASAKRGVPLIFWYLSELADSPAGKQPWGPIDLGPERPDRVEVPALAAPKLDGAIGKEEWAKAAVVDLVHSPDPTRPLAAPTRLRLGYDAKNLYLAVDAGEPKLDQLRLNVKEDGGPVYNDDCVEIYVGPNARMAGVKLVINAAGVRAVGLRGHDRKALAAPVPADFPVTAGRGDAAWLIEVAIPWEKVGLKGAAAGAEAAFNVIRFRMSGGGSEKASESSTWQGTSNQLESVGTLLLGK